jgi:hypothetical protein
MVHRAEEQEWTSPQLEDPVVGGVAFEERMAEADRSASEFSRSLDELGAPLERCLLMDGSAHGRIGLETVSPTRQMCPEPARPNFAL